MHVVRGREPAIDADRTLRQRLLDGAADGEPAVRVWVPHRQLAFGRRDQNADSYDRARTVASEAGFQPVGRSVGGRAVAYDGETTIAFIRAEPIESFRVGLSDRYDRALSAIDSALRGFDIDLDRGEPPETFCPGCHSLSAIDSAGRRRKIVGVAQRVKRTVALVAGVVLVANRAELAAVLGDVYDALDVPLDRATIGTVDDAGGPATPEPILTAIEDALVGESRVRSVESIGED